MAIDAFFFNVLAGVVSCAIWYGVQKWFSRK